VWVWQAGRAETMRRACRSCSKDFARNDSVSLNKHEVKCAGPVFSPRHGSFVAPKRTDSSRTVRLKCRSCRQAFAPNDHLSLKCHESKCCGQAESGLGTQTRDASSSGRGNPVRLQARRGGESQAEDDDNDCSGNEPPDGIEVDICPDRKRGALQKFVDGKRCVFFADGTGYTIYIKNNNPTKIAVLVSIDGRNVTFAAPMIVRDNSHKTIKGFILKREIEPAGADRGATIQNDIEGFVARKQAPTTIGPLNPALGEIKITFVKVRFINDGNKQHKPKSWELSRADQGRARPNVLVTTGGPLSKSKNVLTHGGRFIADRKGKPIRVCGWTICEASA
jgi:hypothetical protein